MNFLPIQLVHVLSSSWDRQVVQFRLKFIIFVRKNLRLIVNFQTVRFKMSLNKAYSVFQKLNRKNQFQLQKASLNQYFNNL